MNDECCQTLAQVSRCPGLVLVNYCTCKLFEAGGATVHCATVHSRGLPLFLVRVKPVAHTLNNNSQATMGNNNNSGVVLTVYTIAVIKNV